ncbi:MAG TPA: SDR family oxidoreductase [Flavitalea sp.]|nr:SDR family oxidoreductase [Flavitalea sp.]
MASVKKIALITGGSRGLGKDMALRLAEKQTDIILTWHTQQAAAEEVVAAIEKTGQKAAAVQFDSSNFSTLGSFLQQVTEILKKWNSDKFDFLINNAGIGATIPFEQVTEADFDRFMNIHFKSVYFLTQRCLPLINDHGRIINISTGTTRFCVPGYSVYASMKGAIETFTRYLAKEVGPRGITANVIAPGPIETDFNNAAIRSNPERKKAMGAMTALGRVGEADDIGGVVAFLCSDDAGWINAQRIEVSGGINL